MQSFLPFRSPVLSFLLLQFFLAASLCKFSFNYIRWRFAYFIKSSHTYSRPSKGERSTFSLTDHSDDCLVDAPFSNKPVEMPGRDQIIIGWYVNHPSKKCMMLVISSKPVFGQKIIIQLLSCSVSFQVPSCIILSAAAVLRRSNTFSHAEYDVLCWKWFCLPLKSVSIRCLLYVSFTAKGVCNTIPILNFPCRQNILWFSTNDSRERYGSFQVELNKPHNRIQHL